MNDNIVVDENKMIYLPKELLLKIKFLIRDKHYLVNKEELDSLDTGKIDERVFTRIYGSIIRSFNIKIESPYDNYDDERLNFDQLLVKELKTLKEEYETIKKTTDVYKDSLLKYDDFFRIEKVINLVYQYTQVEKKMYLIRDLCNAKDDYMIDMKYFMSEDLINKFEIEYREAMQEKNVDKMLNLLNNIQKLILQEWEKYDGNIEKMVDNHFCFIGHSTRSESFNGDFRSRYVSCSLFNQDLNDTFNRRFGFIMAPKNIIGANSKDMYVNNYANDEENVLSYSSIPIIHHPQRLIDECLKQRIKNVEENTDRVVYNEVFIDGFSPIGIFCFTNGAKELDSNYLSAKELQKSFPNLKIKFLDIMKLKKGNDLKKMQLELISSLMSNGSFYCEVGLDELSRYDMFLQKFDELKQKDDYNEQDIKDIFHYNSQLLSFFFIPNQIFDGNLSDEEIKYVLGKNYNFNIEFILNGNITVYALEKLKPLVEYTDKLNNYYDGLSEFVTLLSKVSVDEEIVNEIKSDLPTNFYKMSKPLVKKLMNMLKLKEIGTKSGLSSLKERFNMLKEEYNKRKEKYDKYQSYSIVLDNEFNYSVFQMDLECLEGSILQSGIRIRELINQKEQIEKRINELTIVNDAESSKTVQGYNEYQSIQNEIRTLKEQLNILRRHAFLNIRKIRLMEDKIKNLERESESISIDFEHDKENNIDENNLTIEFLRDELSDIIAHINQQNEELLSYQEQKDNITKKILELFKCSTIEEIEDKIKEARIYMDYNSYYENEYVLQNIEKELQEVHEDILSYDKILKEINMEKESLSK